MPRVVRHDQFVLQFHIVLRLGQEVVLAVESQAVAADLEAANAFLERLLERAADAHGLADRLHRCVERRVRLAEFFEREARDLENAVVHRRLEERVGLAGHVVPDLVERHANGEFRGHPRDGEARGLGRQRAGARQPRVDLDDDDLIVGGVSAELNVGPAARDADLADDAL